MTCVWSNGKGHRCKKRATKFGVYSAPEWDGRGIWVGLCGRHTGLLVGLSI